MNRRVKICGLVFVLLAGSTVAYGAAFDRACERTHTSEICTCSKDLLLSTLGLKDFAFYAVALKKAMENETAGMNPEDAWEAAGISSDKSAEVLAPEMIGKTDELRAAHLEALQKCGG